MYKPNVVLSTVAVIALFALAAGCSNPPPVSQAAVDAVNAYYGSYFIGGGWSVSRAAVSSGRTYVASVTVVVPNADAFQAAGDLSGLARLVEINVCPKGEGGAAVRRLFAAGQEFKVEIRGFSHGGDISATCWR